MKKYIVLGGALVSVPSIAAAADGFAGILQTISGLIGTAVPIVISLAVLYFLWGVARYILKPEDKEDAKSMMIWGIIGLFVMVSIWGLVGLLSDTFDLDTAGSGLDFDPIEQIN